MWLWVTLTSGLYTSMNENHAIVHVQLAVDLTPTNAQAVRIMLRSTFGFKDQTVSLALLRVSTRILSTEDATHAVATVSPALVQL